MKKRIPLMPRPQMICAAVPPLKMRLRKRSRSSRRCSVRFSVCTKISEQMIEVARAISPTGEAKP